MARGRTPIKDQQAEAALFQRRAVLSYALMLLVFGVLLARFGELVDRENIQTLHWRGYNTDYVAEVRRGRAGESHATKVFHFHQELFAEAFAMWKTDRLMLYNQAPALAKFFDDGEHLR